MRAQRKRPLARTYQKIASRRVRLGLLLAEIGEKAGIQVSDDELTQGLIQRARQFPARKAGLGILPQEPAGAGRNSCANLRREGLSTICSDR